MSFAPGDYEFAVTADDGVRLYVDGVRVIDQWIDQGPTTYRTTLPLDGGPHAIVMEYYENGGGRGGPAGLRPRSAIRPATAGYQRRVLEHAGRHRHPHHPDAPADLERDDETLDFDWGDGSPGAGIAADRFVARWTKTVVLSAGVYRFSGGRDDGIRVYIDNVPVVDRWTFGNADYSVDKVVTGGPHELRVEYFEGGGGARAEFAYERIGDVVAATAGTPPSTSPTGTCGRAGPDPHRRRGRLRLGRRLAGDGVPADNFSARWTKSLTLDEAGTYKFTVTGDDGVRLYVDGQKVLDKWIVQGATTYTVTRQLTAGHARDRARVLRGERRRGRQVRLRADRRAAAAAARAVRRGVLRQQHPRRRPGAHPATTRSTSTGARARPAPACPATSSRRAGRGPRPTRPAPIGSP